MTYDLDDFVCNECGNCHELCFCVQYNIEEEIMDEMEEESIDAKYNAA